MARKKKVNISQSEFDNMIKVWTLIVTVLVALIGSVTSIAIAYNPPESQVKQQYSISPDDKLKLSQIRQEYERYLSKYQSSETAKNDTEMEIYFESLVKLSTNEAKIMNKYDQGFQPRFPHVKRYSKALDIRVWYFLILFPLLTFLTLPCFKFIVAKILFKKYIITDNQYI
tara:strand:+ start:322 stop:834 length:513 start_codon:yes stop_codon:yes gene_type:complete